MILDKISHAGRVLILGFAREGLSTFNFLHSKFPRLQIDTADQKDGPDYLKTLQDYGVIIKSPGISPHKPEIVAAAQKGCVFTSHMQIFFEVCPSKNIIGITGTKGKSTTTSLIYEVIKANDLPATIVGNIGKPALDYLSEMTVDSWVVTELSSGQLISLTQSPHIAVLQNIFQDHLDYHLDYEEYRQAKYNITRFQKPRDYFIYNAANSDSAFAATLTQAKLIPFSINDFDPQIKTHLLGDHNKLNIIPSLKIAKILKLPKNKVYQAITDFHPLDTRLELVATKNNIRFYADTLATIPEATIAALDALPSDVETLIAGGHERKQNYSILAVKILSRGIKNLIVFPATGPRIWKEITNINPHPPLTYHQSNTMVDAVKFALDHTLSDKICLLSPAAPSFTLFKDYKDEYEQYKDAINNSAIR